ncbi:uncharacterized protein BCR38DRAFT_354310 [Pseudomassariella vexata]|uniref:BTB domain-containing protein n=1 Tax=Pseudomassariella vexata TaxID=1141098 RepID=A0A1Y2DED6_9PEZI|nr:uncharacterized protein BCR38DRAFT_354310 [Pseudomassariella vexata]ORY57567.1 hypothetical protein BCR38DRAFT_354310 [Pseudomassariella vexata]
MSHLLWKYYWENDVDKFRAFLGPVGYSQNAAYQSKSPGAGVGSPGACGSSPRVATKSRKVSAHGTPGALLKTDINGRDHAGLTLLLRAASSTSPNAPAFAEALIEHPAIDLYVQDAESGWNALHRALYHGNISIARLLLDKERRVFTESLGGNVPKVHRLIKAKDNEGNSPFDVYNATIALRSLHMAEDEVQSDDESESDATTGADERGGHVPKNHGLGSEIFTWGSNKNLTLGLGDQDDRQYPERVFLQRPEHLIQYFHDKHKGRGMEDSLASDSSEVPILTRNRPLNVQDVILSKLHSAILTTDPISNLYICGIGRGGRLGLGDENTQFTFKPVLGALMDKKVVHVALGTSHSMAITSTGELFTWGSNTFGQLGYVLPPPLKADEEPRAETPRQVFGPLKKEAVVGVAASSIHSVCHTGSSLYCWGKNVGQLALMDADSRSLEVQTIPRRVAATLLSSHSSIVMVSAIDGATTVLFEDRTVCVFTNFGYNMVKFPFYDGFTNAPLQRSGKFSLSSRYDPGRREIRSITSGGDTIAALTGSGDVFTMSLNRRVEASLPATAMSTTNPAKIKDSLNPPQLIWSSRKDGAKSVAVGENGSVMIATQSGAVWHRIKRTKAKDTKVFVGGADNRRKDFKFQRVPYITGVSAVRSSTFGAFAAIRKDCDVTRDQIEVDEQTLWDDLAPLCCLRGFKAHNSKTRENNDTWKFQNPAVLRDRDDIDLLAYQVLTSTDLEGDLRTHLRDWGYVNDNLGTVVCTSSVPDIQVPVHSWVLSARSPILRLGLQKAWEDGSYNLAECLTISQKEATTVIEFATIDVITLLNFVVYSYVDTLIPAWNFTRQSPPLAYRYRQIRTEIMKVSAKLGMTMLEQDVRAMRKPSRSMDQDYKKAIEDPTFFEDGDVLLQLDGDAIPVHSAMLCQRCPFFQGLFNGRSAGAWLDARRAALDVSDKVPIDLSHFDPEAFNFVLQHLYSDCEDFFNDVVTESIDDFSEILLDVMSIANELMLDRLSQICQRTLGRFVNTRNVAHLLNLVSPCSVTEFKDKGLEYLTLSMETMLENHLLDGLDRDLLLELDAVARDNQLTRCPFVRSGRTELLLHERHPSLVEDILEERACRVRELAYKTNQREEGKKLSSSFKTRFGSMDDLTSSPPADKSRQKLKAARNAPFSPNLKPKASQAELIFDMDEEATGSSMPPSPRPLEGGLRAELDQLPQLPESWHSKGKGIQAPGVATGSPILAMPSTSLSESPNNLTRQVSQGGNPWHSALPTSRLDLREIMTELRPTRSSLSDGLAAEKKDAAAKATPQKMSQKERKKFLQQQAEKAARQESQIPQQSQTPWAKVGEKDGSPSPWLGTAAAAPKPSPKGVLNGESKSLLAPSGAKPLIPVETRSISIPRRTVSPDTRFSGQNRSGSSTPRGPSTSHINRGIHIAKARPSQAASVPPAALEKNKPLIPHSKSYIPKAPKQDESFLGLGLADIIDLQQRELEDVKEAAAVRSLQDIQQEQAFEQWWAQECKRTHEEEEARKAREKAKGEKKEGDGGSRRGRGGKSKGGPGRDRGVAAANAGTANVAGVSPGGGSRGKARGNKGAKA